MDRIKIIEAAIQEAIAIVDENIKTPNTTTRSLEYLEGYLQGVLEGIKNL